MTRTKPDWLLTQVRTMAARAGLAVSMMTSEAPPARKTLNPARGLTVGFLDAPFQALIELRMQAAPCHE